MSGTNEQAELSAVVAEIAEAMAGRTALLSIHPTGGADAAILCVAGAPLSPLQRQAMLAGAAHFAGAIVGDAPAWRPGFAGSADMIMTIPVDPIAGHSRLIISTSFDRPSADTRRRAEQVYAARKPFAVGYFRFWQLARISSRRTLALESALNLTDIGVLLIDRADRITFANHAGERILACGDALRRIDGRIGTADLDEGVCLQVALKHVAASTHPPGRSDRLETAVTFAIHRRGGPPLIVSLLAPDVRPVEPSDVAAVLFIVDPQLDTGSTLAPICRLYQLSPVETRLVAYLAQGKTLATASELMRVKEQTARSYMKQIFLKTSTNRQSELIVLMLSSAVRMRHGLAQRVIDNDLARSRRSAMS